MTPQLYSLWSINNHIARPIQQPSVRLPELNFGRRGTRMNNDIGINWIGPTEHKVSE